MNESEKEMQREFQDFIVLLTVQGHLREKEIERMRERVYSFLY